MWIKSQEEHRIGDEGLVIEHIENAQRDHDISELAYWRFIEHRMRTTADLLANARNYVNNHPEEFEAFSQEIQAQMEDADVSGANVDAGNVSSHDASANKSDDTSDAGANTSSEGVIDTLSEARDSGDSENQEDESEAPFELRDPLAEQEAEDEGDPYSQMIPIENIDRSLIAQDDESDDEVVSHSNTDDVRDRRDAMAGMNQETYKRRFPKVRNVEPSPTNTVRMIKGVPRHVYAAVEEEILASGAFAADSTYNQGDVVTVALAYLCDISGKHLTEKQARALEVFRKNSKNAQFETARSIRSLEHRLEDVMRSVTADLMLNSYMARRQLGLSTTASPMSDSALDLTTDAGQDEFYDNVLLQGAVRCERDVEQLGRDITASRFGLKTI